MRILIIIAHMRNCLSTPSGARVTTVMRLLVPRASILPDLHFPSSHSEGRPSQDGFSVGCILNKFGAKVQKTRYDHL